MQSLFLEYCLVQSIEDDVKMKVMKSQVKTDDGTTKAMYLDKQYYPCVVLSESGE